MKCVSNIKVLKRISSYPIGTQFRLRNGEVGTYTELRYDIAIVSSPTYQSNPVWDADDDSNGLHSRNHEDHPFDVIGVL